MKFFLEKEEYLDCFKVRDYYRKIKKKKKKRIQTKSLI